MSPFHQNIGFSRTRLYLRWSHNNVFSCLPPLSYCPRGRAAALTDKPRNVQARGIALTGARALQQSEPKDLAAADDADNGLVPARRRLEYGAPGTIAGLATGAMIILVYVILPLIILFSPLILVFLIIVVYRHCRHRKKRINYNPIAMITAEERKERAKQYMAQFNPSQARPVVEAAPVAKMV